MANIKVQDSQIQERLQAMTLDAIVALAKKQIRREIYDSIRKHIWYKTNRERCVESSKLRYKAMKQKADKFNQLSSVSPAPICT